MFDRLNRKFKTSAKLGVLVASVLTVSGCASWTEGVDWNYVMQGVQADTARQQELNNIIHYGTPTPYGPTPATNTESGSSSCEWRTSSSGDPYKVCGTIK